MLLTEALSCKRLIFATVYPSITYKYTHMEALHDQVAALIHILVAVSYLLLHLLYTAGKCKDVRT